MRTILMIILLCICNQGWTQEAGAEVLGASGIETYRIVSDRSMYIVGEEINFRVFNQSPQSIKMMEWSNVFYLELISPQGYSYARAKFELDSLGVSSTIHVPENLPSGIYYLKGYTRWMRNNGPETYVYLSVEIVNPYIRTVVPVDTTSTFSKIRMVNHPNQKSEGFITGNLPAKVETRSPVSLNLKKNESMFSVDCCVSVIRKGMQKAQWESLASTSQLSSERMNHLPETRGISLAGKVEFSQSGLPAPYAVVYISMMENEREFYCNFTDSAGRFHFAFPDQYGENELFISASHHTRDPIKLFVDQDFCKEFLLLPTYPLDVDAEDFELIREMSDNVQIGIQYYPGISLSSDTAPPDRDFFYGDPTSVIRFDDFIKLPTMEEYFSEVTPQVSIRKSNSAVRLRVLGDHPDLDIFPPLVMVDGVAIGKVESVLAVSPRLIKQIEIVEAPYIRGNITFGGIINIISRNDDLGFIDLPESGLLAHYKMFNRNSPDKQSILPLEQRLPDLRNTLYWNPHVELKPGENKIINFSTADTEGEYEAIIRGYDTLGNYFEETIPFKVESLSTFSPSAY
ncbi:MAG: hypothetical protein KAI08_01830 [Bacteroidales bacterium]|nr:hypothetical protein [Bacteroidales bacterium]